MVQEPPAEHAAPSSGQRAAASTKPEQTCYRLRRRRAFWASFVASSLVMSVLTVGFKLQWGPAGPPPPTALPNHSSASQYADFVSEAVASLLAKGAIVVARQAPLFISPLSVVERRGKLRLVLDLSELNSHCTPPPKFKYETIGTATEVFQPGDWMFSIDLEAAYHHVDMHPTAWPYLGFQWQGVNYMFRVSGSTACAHRCSLALRSARLQRYQHEAQRCLCKSNNS